jgi:glycosyltransferase involved in cell wall biosynthesis
LLLPIKIMTDGCIMKKILVFIDWFLPGYKAGGQIPSVANLVRLLYKEFEFSIVTSDRDDGDNSPYPNIQPNTWIPWEGQRIIYLSPDNQSFSFIRKIIKNESFDYIYLNSFFSFSFTLLPLFLTKIYRKQTGIILAPRGMLAQEALHIKKKKKAVFISLAKITGFYNKIRWHASTEIESKEIQHVFGDQQEIITASDISFLPETISLKKRIKNRGEVKLFILSRITPKKNLLYALELLRSLHLQNISFHIIGPVDDMQYWQKCQGIIRDLQLFMHVEYLGSLPNNQLREVLQQFHFMLLPTLNENYGHVIVDSLSAGCPVIISDNTPWRMLEKFKTGWDISLNNKNTFLEVIKLCTDMPQEEYDEWSIGAVDFIKKAINTEELKAANRRLFL